MRNVATKTWKDSWEAIQAEIRDDERELVTKSVKLEVQQYRSIKILVAQKQWLMRDFFSRAFMRLAAKRRKWHEDEKDGGFLYVAGPKEGKLVSFAVLEGHLGELEEWAQRDNVHLRSAYYTAVYEFLEEVKPDSIEL